MMYILNSGLQIQQNNNAELSRRAHESLLGGVEGSTACTKGVKCDWQHPLTASQKPIVHYPTWVPQGSAGAGTEWVVRSYKMTPYKPIHEARARASVGPGLWVDREHPQWNARTHTATCLTPCPGWPLTIHRLKPPGWSPPLQSTIVYIWPSWSYMTL